MIAALEKGSRKRRRRSPRRCRRHRECARLDRVMLRSCVSFGLGFGARGVHVSSSIDDTFPRIFPATWLDALAAHRRTAWRPLVEEGDGELLDSKYGGLAAIPSGEAWPFCGSCGQPMQLFLQLHPRDLPPPAESFLGRRMLQPFVCTTANEVGDATCSASTHFSRASWVRSVAIAEGRHSFAPIARTPVERGYPAARIIGWEPIDDYPNWSEHGRSAFSFRRARASSMCCRRPATNSSAGRTGSTGRATRTARGAGRR